jgi:glycerate kinase
MKIIVAPDSFKGSITAADAAAAIREGWVAASPQDSVRDIPQADGGEGTCDVIAASVTDSQWQVTSENVIGPDGRPVEGRWLRMPGDEAVVELAAVSGLTLMEHLDARRAHTRGLGQTIRDALDHGCTAVSIGLGGSASTDGGSGALRELGVKMLDSDGRDIGDGGEALYRLASIDKTEAFERPRRGVRLLCDVRSPLTGPKGAAAVFGPQKGATSQDVAFLDGALARFASVAKADPDVPGSGAAGGTTYGLRYLWDADVVSGAREVARLTNLVGEIEDADLVITGEGRFDDSSMAGKVVDTVIQLARDAHVPVAIICGQATDSAKENARAEGIELVELVDIAPSLEAELTDPAKYLRAAGARVAGGFRA